MAPQMKAAIFVEPNRIVLDDKPIPDALTDEQVLMSPDIMSTAFSGAERGKVRIGDVVAVFAQGPIGLCATHVGRRGTALC